MTATTTVSIIGNTADYVTIQVGQEVFLVDKGDMKRKVNGAYHSHEFLKWQFVERLLAQGTDLSSNAAIKTDIESGAYFF